MSLVVDASIAVKWLVREARHEEATQLLAIPYDREFCKKATEAGFGDRIQALGSKPISAMIGR